MPLYKPFKTLGIATCVVAALLLVSDPSRTEPIGGAEVKDVDLDRYIQTQRPVMAGAKTIIAPRRIAFIAVLKEQPTDI